jgi:hypothetical protein
MRLYCVVLAVVKYYYSTLFILKGRIKRDIERDDRKGNKFFFSFFLFPLGGTTWRDNRNELIVSAKGAVSRELLSFR